jgi:hypothetical protein
VGWNTIPDAASGLSSLAMGSGNIALYAIYKRTITAAFIDTSGVSKTASATIYNKATSGEVTPPAQSNLNGWTPAGWNSETAASATPLSQFVADESGTTFYGLHGRRWHSRKPKRKTACEQL